MYEPDSNILPRAVECGEGGLQMEPGVQIGVGEAWDEPSGESMLLKIWEKCWDFSLFP
jgi:hypothetical protein